MAKKDRCFPFLDPLVCNWLLVQEPILFDKWLFSKPFIHSANELYVSGLRQTISMTGEIGNQVAFLLMTIALFCRARNVVL